MARVNDDSPLLRYADYNLWGNPEENSQYQVQVKRISSDFGEIRNFGYMNKWRILPKGDRYFHVFSVGGLSAGYWGFFINILKRNPIERWINLGDLASARGLLINIYDDTSINYSKQHAWIMVTYDGLVLLALDKLNRFPIERNTNIYFRCYTPTRDSGGEPFKYVTLVYENSTELATFSSIYNAYSQLDGYVFLYHNGVFINTTLTNISGLMIGDVLELVYDPSVIKKETYTYGELQDFYSSLDSKRKVIVHSPKVKGDFTLRYFDDNDYYLAGHLNRGLYLNRNNVSNIRQLTHNDVSISDDYIRYIASWLRDLEDIGTNKLVVFTRKTDWDYQFPHDNQRLRYLYRLDDWGIIKAMTGERSNIEDWLAENLEKSHTLNWMNSQYLNNNRERALQALGYNAATRVLSESIVRATYNPGSLGVEVPYSYQESFTAFEYSEEGLLLGIYNRKGLERYSPKHPNTAMVEFTLGEGGRTLDTKITVKNEKVDKDWDLRVFINKFSQLTQEMVGDPIEVTGSDRYRIENGTLIWDKLDIVNEKGILVTNKKSLVYTFELDHLDKSLAFAVTHVYEPGGLLLPFVPGQVDIWMNGHPLIDKVEWIYKNGYIYILAREHIKPGPQEITIRAVGLSSDPFNPKFDTELGFVEGGVIGRNSTYHLRGDRVTRTVIGGRLFITDEVPSAERNVPNDQWSELNGLPYMVKHCYTPIRFVRDYSNYPLYEESRAADTRVSGYLTMWAKKPLTVEEEIINEPYQPVTISSGGSVAIPNLGDRYRIFSPFMNVIVNSILNKIIIVPKLADDEGIVNYSKQVLEELVGKYKWWLEHDPVILNFDRRYLAITPYANYEKPVIKSHELQFLKQVNDTYLVGAVTIENYFDINNNG